MPDADVLTSSDLIAHTKGASASGKASKKGGGVAISADKFLDGITNADVRYDTEVAIKLAVGSENVAQYRAVSVAGEQDVLINDQTVFMNMIEANGIVDVTDPVVKINERKPGAGVPEWFNVQGSLPGGRQSNYPSRTNHTGFAGNLLDLKWYAQELVGQSPIYGNADLTADQVKDELILLRRFFNEKLLSNVEITSEQVGTQPGGLVDRSDLNNVAVGPNADLTNPTIQGSVDDIANSSSNQGLNYTIPLVAMVHGGQLAKVDDLMIARFPGENSAAYMQNMAALRQRLANVQIPIDTMAIYRPRPGRPILFVHEPQLPTGTCVLMDPTRLKIGKFRMNGQRGPWVLERPTSALTSLVLVFDCMTLIDHLRETRAVITGLND